MTGNAMDAAVIDQSVPVLFWQTLARAFMPPMDAAVARAFVADLPDDLAQLAEGLGLDAEADISALREQALRFVEPQALLLEYARLFLPPVGTVTLNLASYVDGGGLCMDAIEAAYLEEGLTSGDGLHDLADHAARQLEFMAYLAERSPGAEDSFAQLCLVGALPRLAAQLARCDAASPYTALARIAALAVHDADTALAASPVRANRRQDKSLGVWRNCADCGKPYAREKEIRIMTLALEQAGLPSEHLARCPECRDRAQGFFTRAVG
jgi:TorA maturation chaperone TorD